MQFAPSGRERALMYAIWRQMIYRCHNPKHQNFRDYGARGVSVCERWKNSFKLFLEDVGPKPFEGCQLDRRDNNGNYEPENVRWATRAQQVANKRDSYTSHKVRLASGGIPIIKTVHPVTGTPVLVADLAKELGSRYPDVYNKLAREGKLIYPNQ